MKKLIFAVIALCIMASPAFAKKEGDQKVTSFTNYTGVGFTTTASATYTSVIDTKGYKNKLLFILPKAAASASWATATILTTNPGVISLQGSYDSVTTNAKWFDLRVSDGTGAVYSTAAAATTSYYYWEDTVPYVRIKVLRNLASGGSAGTGFDLILRASGNE